MALRIKRFDPKGIKESRIMFLIGKRHTGKSVLMKDLLHDMPCPDYVLAMAPTEDTLRMFREFLPSSCIFDHFSQEKLDRAVSLQRELVNRGKKRTLLIILDDCLYQKNVLRSTTMRHIFFNGRHDHISLMCAAQYLMDVDVSLRTNIDYLFCMRENILSNRQKLYKYYFGLFAKYDEFDKVMNACTQDYRALVLDNTQASTVVTEAVRWYKASTSVPDFKLCRPVYWRMARRYGLSTSEVRAAQTRQFEMDNACVAANVRRPEMLVVQTEDEHGQVVVPAAA